MTDEKTNAVELAKTDLRAACDMVIERSAAMMVEELGAPIEMMLDRMLTYAGPSMCATGKPSRGDSTGDHTGREARSGQSARCFDAIEGEPMIQRNFHKNGTVATRMTAPLELRFEGSAGGIEGYASAFGGT
jgi:hypothetical protein